MQWFGCNAVTFTAPSFGIGSSRNSKQLTVKTSNEDEEDSEEDSREDDSEVESERLADRKKKKSVTTGLRISPSAGLVRLMFMLRPKSAPSKLGGAKVRSAVPRSTRSGQGVSAPTGPSNHKRRRRAQPVSSPSVRAASSAAITASAAQQVACKTLLESTSLGGSTLPSKVTESSAVQKNASSRNQVNKPTEPYELSNNDAFITDRCKSCVRSVHWQGEEAQEPEKNCLESPSNLGPSSPLFRRERTSKTLHTWIQAMVDDLDAASGSPVSHGLISGACSNSPIVSVRSVRSTRSLRTLPTTPSSTRSSGARCVSPLRNQEREADLEEPVVSVLAMLRSHFLNSIDADGTGTISRQELFDHIRELLEEKSGSLSDDILELLAEVVRCRFAEIDLGLRKGERAGLGMDEWIHFMLLRGSSPSHVAAKHLNRRLSKALADDPQLLHRLHVAFEAADVEGDGLLRQDRWPDAFLTVGKSHPPEEVGLDREEDGSPWALSYYEFVGHALGLKASVVELALYDLSQGIARWVPPTLLGGHRFDGVWHSGVRVFGKEFWFGGAILESHFQDVPFGAPTKILRLGTTLRTAEELVEFLKEDVYVDYNPKSYDALRRNCNHFSNELVQFLLHGKQLPEEVLLQPEWAQSAAITSIVRPLLNRWLGGFGDDDFADSPGRDAHPCTPRAVSRIDDMTEEWRSRLKAGDLVLQRVRFIDRSRPARILSVSERAGRRRAEIVFLGPTAAGWEDAFSEGSPWSWEIVQQSDVPLRQLYPLLSEAEGSAHILKAGLAQRDERAGDILKRSRASPVDPTCPRGHRLKVEETPSWWSHPPPCCICKKPWEQDVNPRHSCSRCSFLACARCMQRGTSLPGGGAFADVLSLELAASLLEDDGWMRNKARSYFFKADHNGAGHVDKTKLRRFDARISAELEVKPLTDSELVKQLQSLLNLVDVTATGSSRTPASTVPLELTEDSFVDFFKGALSRALALRKSGKIWHPRARRIGSQEAERQGRDSNVVLTSKVQSDESSTSPMKSLPSHGLQLPSINKVWRQLR